MSRVAMTGCAPLPGVRRFSDAAPDPSVNPELKTPLPPVRAGLGDEEGEGDTEAPGGGGAGPLPPCNQLLRRADTGGVLCVKESPFAEGGRCSLTCCRSIEADACT